MKFRFLMQAKKTRFATVEVEGASFLAAQKKALESLEAAQWYDDQNRDVPDKYDAAIFRYFQPITP